MTRRTRLLAGPFACLLAAAVAPLAGADDVHLTNGRVFEGVVARIEGERVIIRLDSGEISLPRSRVERIVTAETAQERHRAAERALLERADATAADWLDLALAARRDGYESGYRSALLAAARRDPAAAEVKARLGDLGYVHDDLLGEWLPRDEALRRRGLVRSGDEWLTAAEAERRREVEADRERERWERQRQRRLADTLQAAAELELVRRLAGPPPAPVFVPVASYPIVSIPWLWHPPVAPPVPPNLPPAPEPPRSPAANPESNHGGFAAPGRIDPPDLVPGRLGTGVVPPPGWLGG